MPGSRALPARRARGTCPRGADGFDTVITASGPNAAPGTTTRPRTTITGPTRPPARRLSRIVAAATLRCCSRRSTDQAGTHRSAAVERIPPGAGVVRRRSLSRPKRRSGPGSPPQNHMWPAESTVLMQSAEPATSPTSSTVPREPGEAHAFVGKAARGPRTSIIRPESPPFAASRTTEPDHSSSISRCSSLRVINYSPTRHRIRSRSVLFHVL